jgi:predicted  nucleic acid-binding Zn-ribbon protein
MIFSLLAESSQIKPPEGFATVLESLMYIIVSITAAVTLKQKMGKPSATQSEITNSPLTVEKKPTYATTEELAALKKQVETLSQKMESEYRALLQAGALREASIKDAIHTMKDHLIEKIDEALKQSYHRINEHETRISRTEGQLGIIKKPRD